MIAHYVKSANPTHINCMGCFKPVEIATCYSERMPTREGVRFMHFHAECHTKFMDAKALMDKGISISDVDALSNKRIGGDRDLATAILRLVGRIK